VELYSIELYSNRRILSSIELYSSWLYSNAPSPAQLYSGWLYSAYSMYSLEPAVFGWLELYSIELYSNGWSCTQLSCIRIVEFGTQFGLPCSYYRSLQPAYPVAVPEPAVFN